MSLQRIKTLSLISLLSVSLFGCASIKKVKKALFKDSTLNNLNPAPDKLAPPQKVGEADLIDPTYTRTQADYHYALGEALSMEGSSKRAIEEFKLTLIYDPNSVAVRLRLSAEYIKQGLMSESIEQAERAIEIDPENLEGRLLLGGLYSSLRMYEVAKKQYEFLMITYPDDMEIPIYMGALLAEQGKYDEAEKVFRDLAKNPLNKDPYKSYYYIGRIRAEQPDKEQWPVAEKAFTKAISLKPEDEEAVISLSRLYDQMERPKNAHSILVSYQERFGPKKEVARILSVKYLEKENYEKALDQLEIIEGFEPENLNIKVKISLILIEQKTYDAAINKLEEILRMAPESDKIRFYLGAVYEEVKKPKSAIFHFSKIDSNSMYFSEAVIHSAYMWKVLGDDEKALGVITDAIEKKDDVPQFYAFYASLLDDRKEYVKAAGMLEGAVKKFPEHTQLLFFKGSMYDRLGKKEETIAIMNKIIELDGNHVQALNYLAYTYAEAGERLDEAEALAFKALGLSPDDGYILDTVGWVLYKQGKIQESIKYLEAAHQNASTESIIAEHLGDAYFRSELLEKARELYTTAIKVSEDEDRIREIRTKLTTIDKQKDMRKPASYDSIKSVKPENPKPKE